MSIAAAKSIGVRLLIVKAIEKVTHLQKQENSTEIQEVCRTFFEPFSK